MPIVRRGGVRNEKMLHTLRRSMEALSVTTYTARPGTVRLPFFEGQATHRDL
jgi:hypothetical protein